MSKPTSDRIELSQPQTNDPEALKSEADLQNHQLKSNLDQLPLWQATWLFRRNTLICALASFSATTDGYQYQLTRWVGTAPFTARIHRSGRS